MGSGDLHAALRPEGLPALRDDVRQALLPGFGGAWALARASEEPVAAAARLTAAQAAAQRTLRRPRRFRVVADGG